MRQIIQRYCEKISGDPVNGFHRAQNPQPLSIEALKLTALVSDPDVFFCAACSGPLRSLVAKTSY